MHQKRKHGKTMRPVNKGGATQRTYKTYQEARPELLERLGQYCSYCEIRLESALAVEHVLPKEKYPQLELDWDNFLLACSNCNSTKGERDLIITDYLWPHLDNTFRAIQYSDGGIVSPAMGLPADIENKADATIKLTGLDKTPLNNPTASDRRWQNRRETWDIAHQCKKKLASNNTPQMKDLIVELCKAKGYWSIWMTVFQGDDDMLQRFINAFPGTCCACFIPITHTPIARQGGQY